MNGTIRLIAAVLVTGATMMPASVRAQAAPDVTLRQAAELAKVKGDLKGAIELYKKVADGSDRGAAAKALLAMAECYQTLGDKEAARAYQRLVREFADQKEAAIARTRLGAAAPVSGAKGDRAVWTGQAVDLFGMVSPDGRYLTYNDWDKTGNLLIRDLAANTDRALTDNVTYAQHGYAEWSAISRDGSQVAYSWWISGRPIKTEVRVSPLSGTGVPASRAIWQSGDSHDSIRPFDWSPDGKSLVVLVEREDRTSQLATLNVSNGELRVLKSLDWRGVSKAAFSPDGRYIAYDLAAGDPARNLSVFVMATDASHDAAVVAEPAHHHVMGWSPDGRHILYASDKSGALALWALPVNDGRPAGSSLMVKSDLPSSWSLGMTTSGALYVWKRASAAMVRVVPVDLAAGTADTAHPVFQRFIESRGRPQWSPSGKELVYISCGLGGGDNCRISIYSTDNATVRDVPHTLGYVAFPRLSPDGRMIATSGTDLKGRKGLYLINLETKETTMVVADAPSAPPLDWTLDSKAIIYAVRRGSERVLVQRDVRSGAEKDLIAVPRECTLMARISPDGKLHGCLVADGSGRSTAMLVAPLDGTAPHIAIKAEAGESFNPLWSWTPDSRGAILLRNADSSNRAGRALWLYPFVGSPRPLGLDANNWADPNSQVDPSGRYIAFTPSAGAPGSEVWALENFLPAPTAAKR